MVTLHSDLRDRGKQWCKTQVDKQSWEFRKYTDVYEDTFCFEQLKAAQNFEMEFGNYAKSV